MSTIPLGVAEPASPHGRPARNSWARLLRVFDFDLEHFPNCGGELRIIAAILEAPVLERLGVFDLCEYAGGRVFLIQLRHNHSLRMTTGQATQ